MLATRLPTKATPDSTARVGPPKSRRFAVPEDVPVFTSQKRAVPQQPGQCDIAAVSGRRTNREPGDQRPSCRADPCRTPMRDTQRDLGQLFRSLLNGDESAAAELVARFSLPLRVVIRRHLDARVRPAM